MSAGSSIALTMVRVERGAARPSDEACRVALDRDRAALGQPAPDGSLQVVVTGPYHIVVDGHELDEYVVWES